MVKKRSIATRGMMSMTLSERIKRGELAVAKARAAGRWDIAVWERHLEDLRQRQTPPKVFVSSGNLVSGGDKTPRFESYPDRSCSVPRSRYNLVIPFDSPPKYHYWNGGQSVRDTATELVLSDLVKRKIQVMTEQVMQ